MLLQSEGTRFVPNTGVLYRVTPTSRLSYVGDDRKKDALLLSMRLHIKYIRSLEDSARVRRACLAYLQTWYLNFYPERPDIVAELQNMAGLMNQQLEEPQLRWKYAWMEKLWDFETAKRAQFMIPQFKAGIVRQWDKFMHDWEKRSRT